MQNHSLNYCNRFRLTTLFQSTTKQIHLIFVDTLLILSKILLTSILNFSIINKYEVLDIIGKKNNFFEALGKGLVSL